MRGVRPETRLTIHLHCTEGVWIAWADDVPGMVKSTERRETLKRIDRHIENHYTGQCRYQPTLPGIRGAA